MGAAASLNPSALSVVPGAVTQTTVRVRNTGTVVDELTLHVVGPAVGWATVEPASLSLFPGADGTAVVSFAPPRSAEVGAGVVAFAVRVQSKEDPQGSVAEEGTIEVGAYADLLADLVPRTSRGARGAAYELAVDNRGNTRVNATIRAVDPDDQLELEVDPPALVAEPNTANFAHVKVKPRKTFRKGPPQTRMFQVFVEADSHPPVMVQGTMLQEQTMPPWLKRAALAGALALMALALLWFGVGKPAVRSAAKEAAIEAVSPTIGDGSGGDAGGPSGNGGADVAVADAVSGPGGGGGGPGSPFDARLFLTDDGSVSLEVPAGRVLQLTDIVLQNPAGESGRLQIRRGNTPLLVVELANFRDLDYHFVSPVVFTAGQQLTLNAECSSPTCTPGAYFTGFLVAGG